MWVQRTAEETAKWNEAAIREARNHGRLIAGMVWILVSAGLAGGWMASAQFAVIADTTQVGGSFWSRWPTFGLIMLPFCWWLYRRESKRDLATALNRTICPRCETASEGNHGSACKCGGSFVPQSTVKWEEDENPSTRDALQPKA